MKTEHNESATMDWQIMDTSRWFEANQDNLAEIRVLAERRLAETHQAYYRHQDKAYAYINYLTPTLVVFIYLLFEQLTGSPDKPLPAYVLVVGCVLLLALAGSVVALVFTLFPTAFKVDGHLPGELAQPDYIYPQKNEQGDLKYTQEEQKLLLQWVIIERLNFGIGMNDATIKRRTDLMKWIFRLVIVALSLVVVSLVVAAVGGVLGPV